MQSGSLGRRRDSRAAVAVGVFGKGSTPSGIPSWSVSESKGLVWLRRSGRPRCRRNHIVNARGTRANATGMNAGCPKGAALSIYDD